MAQSHERDEKQRREALASLRELSERETFATSAPARVSSAPPIILPPGMRSVRVAKRTGSSCGAAVSGAV